MSMLDLIKGGGAFVNPMAAPIASVSSAASSFGSNVVLQTQLIAQGWTPTDITEVETLFSNRLQQSMNDVLSHTNKQAGIDTSGSYHIFNILSIGSAAGGGSCDDLIEAFGAIIAGAAIIAGLIDLITNIDKYGAAIFKATVNSILDDIDSQIQRDLNQYQYLLTSALQNLAATSLAGLLGNNCFGAIIGGIASNELRDEINKNAGTLYKVSSSVSEALSKRI